MIAGAIYFSNNTTSPQPVKNSNDQEQGVAAVEVSPVTEEDHIRGNPNAPIMIVEYSDFDCPFCKRFHETMRQVMDNYGTTGEVAWVFRNMPLEQLHPSAPHVAAAAECVAKLAGNDAFWKFSDLVYEERNTNEPTNLSRLNEFATTAGVDEAALEACLESGETRADVEADFNEAIAAGAQGTPYPVIMIGDQTAVIEGAQPYSVVKQVLDNLISQMNGEDTNPEVQ